MVPTRTLALSAILALLLTGPTPVVQGLQPDGGPDRGKDAQADDVREAIFRYRFQHDGPLLQGRVAEYFLSVSPFTIDAAKRFHGQDPSRSLLRRFSKNQSPVQGLSHCQGRNGPVAVWDKKMGRPGAIFWIGPITWKDGGAAEAESGYWVGSLDASSSTYAITSRNGRWTVTAVKGGGIALGNPLRDGRRELTREARIVRPRNRVGGSQ